MEALQDMLENIFRLRHPATPPPQEADLTYPALYDEPSDPLTTFPYLATVLPKEIPGAWQFLRDQEDVRLHAPSQRSSMRYAEIRTWAASHSPPALYDRCTR